MKDGVDQKTQKPVTVARTRVLAKSMLLDTYCQENINLVMSKYWNGDSVEIRKEKEISEKTENLE